MASSYYDSSGKNVVDGDVAYAADLNNINIAADTGFQLVEAAVDAIAANQSFYSDLAEKWAENPEDTAVTPGKYSALHWAAKAEDQAILADADRVQTGLDAIATAADRVQTGLDKTATAADRVQTGLDKVATAADRVQTGLDVTAAAGSAAAAAASAITAASFVPTPASGDEGKVMAVANPFSNGYELVTPRSGRKNYLINGNFDIWQRGVTLSTDGYLADRWRTSITASTKVCTRQAFTLGQTEVPGNPKYFCRTVLTSVANAAAECRLVHYVEGVDSLSGKTATLSFWAKADAAKNIAVSMFQNFGTGGSPSAIVNPIPSPALVGLTSAWKKYSLTINIPSVTGKTLGTNNNDCLVIQIWLEGGSNYNPQTANLGQQSGTFDIAQVQLEEGEVATEFEKRTYGDEFQLCTRYCQSISINTFISGYLIANNQAYLPLTYVDMRIRPALVFPVTLVANVYSGSINFAVTSLSFIDGNLLSATVSGSPFTIGQGTMLKVESLVILDSEL